MRVVSVAGASTRAGIAARCVVCSIGLLSAVIVYSGEPPQKSLSIPLQPLANALRAYADQTGEEVVYFSEIGNEQLSTEVVGSYTDDAALQKLLSQTDLTFERLGANAIAIIPRRPAVVEPALEVPSHRKRDSGAPNSAAAYLPTYDNPLAEVVVTATRRSEAISKVPLSVIAVTQATLDEQEIKTVEDLQRTVPGLVFVPGGVGAANTIAIRGISSTAGASTTGVYVDDTPIQLLNVTNGTSNTIPALYDLDRIEVLRGPQGTLFGAGAEGGVVRYISPAPSLTTFSGNTKVELGSIDHGAADFETSAAFGGPIVADKLGFRVNAFYRSIGGWIDRVDYRDYNSVVQPNFNDGQVTGGRLALGIAPTERLLITPSVITQFRQWNGSGGAPNQFNVALSNPGDGTFRTSLDHNLPVTDRWEIPALKVQYDFAAFQVISNTSYFHRNFSRIYSGLEYLTFLYDSDSAHFLPGVAAPLQSPTGVHLPIDNYNAVGSVYNGQSNLMQELRLQSTTSGSRLTWVLGLYAQRNAGVFREQIRDPRQNDITEALFGVPAQQYWSGIPLIDGLDSYRSRYESVDKQVALFGQADYLITDKLKLTAGGRYSRNAFTFTQQADGQINAGASSASGRADETPFTPKLGISYQANHNNLLYASYAKGYRIGGANPNIPVEACASGFALLGIPGVPGSYKSDTTQSYEIGSKNLVLDNHLQLASSVYYTKWQGIQSPTIIPNCGYSYIANRGAAVSKGFDVQAQANLFDGLSLNAAFAYTDAAYTQDITVAGEPNVRSGDSLGGPEWTLATGGQYKFVAFSHQSYIRVDWQHASRQKGLTPTQDPLVPRYYDPTIPLPSATNYVTLRLGTHFKDLELALFADNLLNSFDNLVPTHDLASPIYYASAFRPRTISIIASYKF